MDVYEGGIRIPFIAYWKGKIKPGSVSDLVSGHWDMYNTFAELWTKSKSLLMEFPYYQNFWEKRTKTTRIYLF